MIIDTHAHINFREFHNDGDDVIKRSLSENTWMVLVGAEYKTSKRALEYANKYENGVYAAVGLHPIHLEDIAVEGEGYKFHSQAEEFYVDSYEKLCRFDKVVAIGEIGLDYYHIKLNENTTAIKNNQKKVFVEQLLLARKEGLPAIIHCRQAHDDMISVLEDFRKAHRDLIPQNRAWAVMHCFSGDEDLAWKYFQMGIIISFTGLVTFSAQWDDLIRKLPLDKFLVETDCPFMTPEPHRGKRNEPIFVKYVAERIADIKRVPKQRIIDQSTENARQFFGI